MTNTTEETQNSDLIVITINKKKILIGLATTATVVGGFALVNYLSKKAGEETVLETVETVGTTD